MRLFLIAAIILFVLAGLVASFSGVNLVIGAVAWIAWGLVALALDFFTGYSLPVSGVRRTNTAA